MSERANAPFGEEAVGEVVVGEVVIGEVVADEVIGAGAGVVEGVGLVGIGNLVRSGPKRCCIPRDLSA
jgi:hypothetical protein